MTDHIVEKIATETGCGIKDIQKMLLLRSGSLILSLIRIAKRQRVLRRMLF